MMKFVYIASIPVLIILVVIYAVVMLCYHPLEIDNELTARSNSLIKNSPMLNAQEFTVQKGGIKHDLSSTIWENSLFDPNRGGASGTATPEGLKNIQVVGIFDRGNEKGAVIVTKTSESGSSGRGVSSIGRQSGYSSNQQQINTPPAPKTIFRVGERLPNGLVLESVGRDFVMLHGGKESVKLGVIFADDESMKRIAEVSKFTKPPVTTISATSTRGSTGSQNWPTGTMAGTGSPFEITPSGLSNQPQSQGVFQGYGR